MVLVGASWGFTFSSLGIICGLIGFVNNITFAYQETFNHNVFVIIIQQKMRKEVQGEKSRLQLMEVSVLLLKYYSATVI